MEMPNQNLNQNLPTKPKLPPKPKRAGMKSPIIAGLVAGVVIASIVWWVVLRKQSDSEVKSQQIETQEEQTTEDENVTDQEIEEETEGEDYVVQSGDTLSSIAAEFDIDDWRDIAKANDLEEPYDLYVGQELTIPTGKTKGENTEGYSENDYDYDDDYDYDEYEGEIP